METLVARFSITGWEPTDVAALDPAWAGAVTMRKEYTAGLTGTSVALFVSSGEVEGERAYVAVERLTGVLDDGRSGSVTVHHGGLESDPATWFGHVVPGTGTDGLEGLAGRARIVHDDEGAALVLELA